MKVVIAILLTLVGLGLSIPAMLMIPFSIPGTCADWFCAKWAGFVAAAASPFVFGPLLITASIMKVRAGVRAMLGVCLLGMPAAASGLVISLLMSNPG